MDDLDDASVQDIKDFFRVYYAPNNAVLVISGSFDQVEAKTLVETYFGAIPRQALPAKVDVTEPEEVAEREKVYEDKLAPLQAFIMGWKIPPRRSPEFNAIYLAGKLLFDGESSRLYQKLVKGEEIVLQLFGFTDERRGPSGIIVGAIPKEEKYLARIREVIEGELNSIATDGVGTDEMTKLRNQLINDVTRSRQSSLLRAQQLAEHALYDGDAALINTELEEYLRITAADIKQAVARFMLTENRAFLKIVPAGNGETN
jgi:predicted Zn-dependent peptidase